MVALKLISYMVDFGYDFSLTVVSSSYNVCSVYYMYCVLYYDNMNLFKAHIIQTQYCWGPGESISIAKSNKIHLRENLEFKWPNQAKHSSYVYDIIDKLISEHFDMTLKNNYLI